MSIEQVRVGVEIALQSSLTHSFVASTSEKSKGEKGYHTILLAGGGRYPLRASELLDMLLIIDLVYREIIKINRESGSVIVDIISNFAFCTIDIRVH